MEFNTQIKAFAERINDMLPNILTEEATKTSLIMPFFQILGYNVFDPQEFIPEFTADVGIKKGEKVDYAIKIDNQVVILIEAKSVNEKLEKHDSQLFRYFTTSNARFAILTNGLNYKFFTDLDEHNKMDAKPFLDLNITDLRASQIVELAKFHKSNFDIDYIFDAAEELKYTTTIKTLLSKELENPSLNFINYVIGEIYTGRKTQNVIDKFTPLVKKSFSQFINELMNDRIKTALDTEPKSDTTNNDLSEDENNEENSKIETTEEEIEIFYIIKQLLKDVLDYNRICYKDTESYFNILIDNNTRKWVCRYYSNSKSKYLIINDIEMKNEKCYIDSPLDIYNYSHQLESAANQFS